MGDIESRQAQAVTPQSADRLRGVLRFTWNAVWEFGPDLLKTFLPGLAIASKVAKFVSDQAGLTDKVKELTARQGAMAAAGKGTAAGQGLEQSHIFEQYTNVLRALAKKQPLLLILDDLHWVDAGSTSLLFHLGRRIADSRILILGAYRPDEVALGRGADRHPMEKVLAEFKRYGGDLTVDVGSAAAAEGRAFVDAYLDTEPNQLDVGFREALFRHTGGHPLFLVELLRTLQERGSLARDARGRWAPGPDLDWNALPPRAEGVVEERIGRLESDLRQTLAAASVEGAEFTAEVVAQVRQVEERELVRWLSGELDRQHRLVQAQGMQRIGRQRLSTYRFRHELFQRYLYGSLDEIERAYLHQDVGAVLESLYADQTALIAPQLAHHFLAAKDPERALPYLIEAGQAAAARVWPR